MSHRTTILIKLLKINCHIMLTLLVKMEKSQYIKEKEDK